MKLILSSTVTPDANDTAIQYLRTELAQFSSTSMYAVCLRGLSNQDVEPLKSQMYCTAVTTMFLFEVVWEEARLDYPDIFGLDEIQGRAQMIRERTNSRIDKLVLATVGLGRKLGLRRSSAVDGQGDVAQGGETKKKSKSKTKAESRRDEIKVSSHHSFADSRAP